MTLQENKREEMLRKIERELEFCVNSIQEHSSDAPELLDQIKSTTRELCEIDNNYAKSKGALAKVRKQYEKDCKREVDAVYAECYEKQHEQEYNAHPLWKKIEELVGKAEEADESLICSGSTSVYIDPLSKGRIKKVCRNTVCKHIYDYDNIMAYLKRKSGSKKGIRCPYVGCINSNVLKEHLETDSELQKKLDRMSFGNVSCDAETSTINISL